MKNYPPYTITDKMLNLATTIMEKIGEANYFKSLNKYPELRRKSRIRSIHSSLAIENNQLSLFQVEDVINGKPAILSHWEKAFTYLPIESMIKKNHQTKNID